MKTRLINTAVIVSQLTNVWLFDGNPDETVSARCYRNRYKRYWRTGYKTINRIFFWQKDHCKISHYADRRFASMVFG